MTDYRDPTYPDKYDRAMCLMFGHRWYWGRCTRCHAERRKLRSYGGERGA